MQVHLTAYAADMLNEVSTSDLQAAVRELARTWDDRVREKLVELLGDERGRMLAARWAQRLPEQYKASLRRRRWAPRTSRAWSGSPPVRSDLVVGLANTTADPPRTRRVALQARSEGRARPCDAAARAPRPACDRGAARRALEGEPELWVQSFARARAAATRRWTSAQSASASPRALGAVWRGESESDSLNRLVVSTDLGWRQIEILRAYRRYRQRIGSRYTESFQNDVIAANPRLTEKQMRLFELRFDPADRGSEQARSDLHDEILRRPRRGRAARPRPHPAQPARADRGDGAHERLHAGPRRDGVQAALAGGAGDPAARAAVRDLRLRARHGGHPPARRAHRARRASAGRTAWTTAPRSSGSCARR